MQVLGSCREGGWRMVIVIVMVLGMVLAAVVVMAIVVAMAMVPMVVNDCL